MDIVLLLHEVDEILMVHVRFQLLEDGVKLGLVLVLSLVIVESHLALHLTVVLRHEFFHPVHHVVLSLSFDRLLIVLQLSREEVSLGVLELQSLLLCLSLVNVARDFEQVGARTVLDLVGVDKPNVIFVVSDKLARHL